MQLYGAVIKNMNRKQPSMKYKILLFIISMTIVCNTLADEKQIMPVRDVNFVADYYAAVGDKKYGVLVLGGSGGGKPDHLANKIAAMGHSVLSLAYFKESNLPKELEMIPLEYFEAPKKWLLSQAETRDDGLIIVGWSKGAELSLLLASQDDSYKAIIGIAPSSVVWAGILEDWTKTPSSSWSKNSEPLTFVPFASGVEITKLVDLYKHSLKDEVSVKNATIKVGNIDSPVLLLTGGFDEIWPANEMAASVCQQMNDGQSEDLCMHINYDSAGHLLDEEFVIGGTAESNAKANKDSKQKMAQFLKEANH